MMKDLERDIERADIADEEELKSLAYHPSSKVMARVLRNKNLTEDIVMIITSRKNIQPEILESIANDRRWKESHKIIYALCKNPKTPQKIVLALLKSLRIFDLADLTRNCVIPTTLRMRIEANIAEKLPGMALGIKVSLAKRASSNVLMQLIKEGLREVVAVCLDSPYLTEGDIYKVLHLENISPQVVRMIASHKKWSKRYMIRYVLITNNNAPLACVVTFLKHMKTKDLKDLYSAPEVPSVTKPFIYRELFEREEVEID